MLEFGQALNAGHSPSTDMTSNPAIIVSSESGQWMEYLMMMPLSMLLVDLWVDTFNPKSCLPKSALSRANEIACSGQLNGSHMNPPSGRMGTNGGRLRSSRVIVEAQDDGQQ